MKRLKRRGYEQSLLISLAILFSVILFISPDSFAGSKIPKVRLSVKPLDLSRAPSTDELMAAGQLGGQLYPTADIEIKDGSKVKDIKEKEKIKRDKAINLSFGRAIQEWNRHEYKKAVKMFKQYVKDYPDSPWTDEALLHVGCDARYNGRYSEAEEMFKTIMEHNKDKEHYGAKMLRNKARSRLAVLRVLQSNFKEATGLFAELKKDSPDWRHRTYASHWIQRISRYKGNELALLNCGTEALAQILKMDRRDAESREVMEILPSSLKGNSLKELVFIAEKYGYKVKGLKLAAAELESMPLPAILQINGKNKGNRGHYWVLEKIDGGELTLFDSQSGRRFHQSKGELSREWDGNAIVFSNNETLPGALLSDKEMEKAYGGCCGTPIPEDDLGDPPVPPDPDDDDPCGSPIWKVNMINMNFYMTDIPLWYDPPKGPAVRIKLSYNSQSAIANNEPFGNKWQFNYGGYIVEDTGGNVTVFMPDGRRDVYTPDGQGGYTRPHEVHNDLVKIEDNHYEVRFPDGRIYEYDIPAGTGSQQPFMIEMRDAYGQALTIGYNVNVQLETVTDASGKITTLIYNANGLVERVDDPFYRSAHFEYDANDNLTKITDMGGIWTELAYDSDSYVTMVKNSKGQWGFYIEPADGVAGYPDDYPPPGDITWEIHRITVTNPGGGKEEFFYHSGCGWAIGVDECAYSWYVSPRDYVPYASQLENNFRSARKTLYFYDIVSGRGEIRKITYPEGGYIEYRNFDPITGKATLIDEYHGGVTHSTQHSYNTNGRKTSFTDAKGNNTTYEYYANGIDLWKVRLDLAGTPGFDDDILIKTYTYNGDTHDVATVTDQLGIITEYSYNTYGRLTAITRAKGATVEMTTEMVYDPVTHELNEIKTAGNTVSSFTYDTVGRVKTRTDSSGFTLTYHEYDGLNQPTKITFPDTVFNAGDPESKFTDINYSSCCPGLVDNVTNRSGLTTTYVYDGLKRLTEVQSPEGVIKYEYDANGNRTKLIDAEMKETSFEYDLDNRLVKKIYEDGKFITYEYDLSGLLTKITNARNIEKAFMYDENHNILTVDYSDGTPDVTFTYDDYDQLDTMTDGIGVYDYGYDDVGRVTGIDGPWADDTITFQYNDLGQLKTLTPQNGQSITYYYDYDPENPGDTGLGRLKDIEVGSGSGDKYTYGYTGVNRLIESLTRPNGSYTEYNYNDPLKRLTDIINRDSSEQVINSHSFTYNNLDLIGTETVTTGIAYPSQQQDLKTYDSNNVNQLLNATSPSQTFTYDDDGNMTQGYTPAPDNYTVAMTYDAENRLVSAEYTDSGAVVHRTEYFYSGDNFLAEIKKYEDSSLVKTIRIVRAGFLPVQERDENNTVTREYTWGIDMGGGIGGLLNLKQGGNDYSYLYDGKGNVMAVLNSTENVVASYRYDEFGNLMAKTGTLDQPFMFSTKRYDQSTGTSYYGYRFYSSCTGRWMTRDPLGELGGINLYGFVGNNAVNWSDPLGLYIGQMPPSPPGYNPSTWDMGIYDDGTPFIESPAGRRYLPHPEDSTHWRHWDIQDKGGKPKGRWPDNPIKPRPNQKKLKPNQSKNDPSRDAPEWTPPPGFMPFVPLDSPNIRIPGRIPVRIPIPIRIPVPCF